MRRFAVIWALACLLVLGPAWAQTPIDSLPPVGTAGSVYPLPDPGFITENLWITQNGVDYKIDPLRAGYIYLAATPPSVPYLYQLWWDNSLSLTRPTIKYYDGSQWIPLIQGSGVGTVVQINQGDGITLTPNPIISIGTVACTQFATAVNGCVSGPTPVVGNFLRDDNTWQAVITSIPGCNTITALAYTNCTQHYTDAQSAQQCFYPANADPVNFPCVIAFDGVNFTFDFAAGQHFVVNLPAGCVPLLPADPPPCHINAPINFPTRGGQVGMVDFVQPTPPGATVSWDPVWKWGNAVPVILTIGAGADDFLAYYGKTATQIVMGVGPLNAQ
jgi:hypothetical protein